MNARISLLLMMLVSFFQATSAEAASNECAIYDEATLPDGKGQPAVVSDNLLADMPVATRCLIGVLDRLGQTITKIEDIENPAKEAVALSATAAFQRMVATQGKSGNAQLVDPRSLASFIDGFNSVDTLGAVSALSYGARSSNKDLRVNSVLLLGNVIDNQTVCVPLVHLNDSSILSSAGGVSGRANLLGVVSVVASWANKENYDTMQATAAAIGREVANDGNFVSTAAIVENILKRLQAQSASGNKTRSLSQREVKECRGYAEQFGDRISSSGKLNLKY